MVQRVSKIENTKKITLNVKLSRHLEKNHRGPEGDEFHKFGATWLIYFSALLFVSV